MNNKYRFPAFLLFFCSIFLASCSASFLSEQYAEFDFDGYGLTLFPVNVESIVVNNKQDITSDLIDELKQPKEIISDSLYSAFTSAAIRRFRKTTIPTIRDTGINRLSLTDTSIFFPFTVIGDDSLQYRFHFPRRSFLERSGAFSRFVLVIGVLKVSTDTSYSMAPTQGMPIGTGSMVNLSIHVGYEVHSLKPYFEYAIWDYETDQMVLYGHRSYTIAARTFDRSIDNITWRQFFQSVSLQILKDIPFR